MIKNKNDSNYLNYNINFNIEEAKVEDRKGGDERKYVGSPPERILLMHGQYKWITFWATNPPCTFHFKKAYFLVPSHDWRVYVLVKD